MSTIKTTVYIPSHNYGRFLKDAIESVLRQTVDSWELLIIDDASIDNTSDIIRLYLGHERIRSFKTDGVGLPAVCNLALREAKGEYIIRLDADDVFDENILLVLANFLDRSPECGMVFPDYFLIDEYNEIFAHERTNRIYDSNHMLDNAPNGACCMIRKQALEDVGGYREDLGAQDGFDIWRKLLVQHKPANINLPLFYYRRHGENLTNSASRILLARQQLKLESVANEIERFRPITAVIPCRKNYDFVPDLWNLSVNGKTLLELAIERSLKSKLFDNVIVTSDTDDVKKVMEKYDDVRLQFFERKKENTLRSLTLARTLSSVAERFDPQSIGIKVIVYLQAPFVRTATLEDAVYTLILNGADCSLGVEEIRVPLYKRTAYGLQAINPPRGISTDFDIVYRDVGTALATQSQNLRNGSLTGPVTVKFIVESNETFVINSEQSHKIAESLIK
jgi:glycosyltransferase involved in cell wall biosynthesis